MKKSILLVLLYLLIQTLVGGVLTLLVSQWSGVDRVSVIIIALFVADVVMAAS